MAVPVAVEAAVVAVLEAALALVEVEMDRAQHRKPEVEVEVEDAAVAGEALRPPELTVRTVSSNTPRRTIS